MSTTVASTEFQNRVGFFIEQAAKAPVFITRHRRAVRVLIDIDEYERLKTCETRRAYFAHEVPDAWLAALDSAGFSHIDRGLDKLMD